MHRQRSTLSVFSGCDRLSSIGDGCGRSHSIELTSKTSGTGTNFANPRHHPTAPLAHSPPYQQDDFVLPS
ncbi:hypothetical protein [Microcoleus sp. Pol12B4]|uniref:hypothetical protein n=1 Tax=Microcoleus sp. Pol12B4 TaxID=3055395 RepID=UPI002FD4B296